MMELSSTVALPLQLLRSDTIPPSPSRCPTGSTIDWIPDFAGYAWVAYGASSLLVISHLPSPLSRQETSIAPILRQAFQLPHHVAAVSWSSDGEVAAASGDCIFLFFPESAESAGSFCWSQNAILRHSLKVEAVSWTGSGDGIVAGGVEVVFWKRKSTTWEISWKFIADLPQTLASTTWTIEGPSATAACPYKQHKEEPNVGSQYVLVFQNDGKNGYLKAELRHPLPVLTIQWRPLTGVRHRRNLKTRNVLLTCCTDGAARLWTEIDHGRAKKMGKDANNSKVREHSFCVVAIVETDDGLHAAVPGSQFFMWARDAGGLSKLGEAANCIFSTDICENEETGQCEWLVGFNQDMTINFWAIHCLDEFSPLRYPRVTLWKKKELQGIESEHACNIAHSIVEEGSVSKKVIILRKSSSGPPMLCSFLHYSKYNSLTWSLFYNHELTNEEDLSVNRLSAESFLSCSAGGVLSSDGHSGKILQAVVHPYCYEDGLLASLDSNGLLLFWSFPAISAFSCTVPLSIPTLKRLGRISTETTGPKYTSLSWAPSVMDDDLLVLLGHVDGVDCLVVRTSKKEQLEVEYHKLCTIPVSEHDPIYDGPTDIYSVSLPLPCSKTFKSAKLMLLGVWMKTFLAVSWEIVIHSYDLSRSIDECNCNNSLSDNSNTLKCESVFSGRRYCLSISPCSSHFPSPNDSDQVTSYSVVCPSSFCPFVQQDKISTDALHYGYPPYIIATGYTDGSLKLWSNNKREFPSSVTWELVGALVDEQGPISKISLTDSGQKIATVCASGHPDTARTLNIWQSVTILGAGCFVLEDTLSLDSDVISMKWLTLGNGNQILGVCMKDKLQVYAQRRSGGPCVRESAYSCHMHVWFCIAYALISPPASDFFWGRGATAAVVHQDYISLYGQLLQCQDGECQGNLQRIYEKKVTVFSEARCAEANTSRNAWVSTEGNSQVCSVRVGELHGIDGDGIRKQTLSGRAMLWSALPPKLGIWSMLEVVEQLCGSLPIYHPEVLRYNILSGNWRRACIALEHLVSKLPAATGKRKNHKNNSLMVPQIDLSSYLEGVATENLTNKGFQWSGDTTFASSMQFHGQNMSDQANASISMFAASSPKHDFVGIAECVERSSKAVYIHDKEKIEILSVIDLLSEVSNSHSTSAYESLDDAGRRFWVTVRYQQLNFFRKFGKAASVGELVIDSSTICWAFHSDCQENLLGSILPNEPTWQEIRAFGVGFWFTNVTQLRTRMEKLARLQYLKRKDPKDCALLYIALNRLQVLAGLFKISKDEKDKPLVAFLSRNFQEEKNKAAALKNAYVLLGRHQLELAVAFFLLGGDTYSAISVCAKNLGDEQLALVLCRLIEGPGGQSEHQLINKFMLPSAIENRDYWLTSLLEWQVGNYSRSFFCMLGFQDGSLIDKSSISSNHIAFLEPSIGLYCRMLTTKNHLKNAVGEHDIPLLLRWANLAMATALKRCGLPIEALECFLFPNLVGGSDHGSVRGQSEMLIHKLNPSVNSSNWLLGDVAINLEYQLKLDLVLQHFSKFMREHPSWPDWNTTSTNKYEIHEYDELRGHFNSNLYRDLDLVEQKFSLRATSVITRILVLPFNYGASYIGFDLLREFREKSSYVEDTYDLSNLYSLHKLPLTLSAEFSTLFSQFSAVCGISCQTYPHYRKTGELGDIWSKYSVEWETRAQDLKLSLWNLRAALQIFSDSDIVLMKILHEMLDLIEFLAQFASFWFGRNSEALILILQPLLVSFSNGHTPYEVQIEDLKEVLDHLSDLVPPDSTSNGFGSHPLLNRSLKDKNVEYTADMIPEDDRWQILGASLWLHISRFTSLKLKMACQKLDENILSGASLGTLPSDCSSVNLDAEGKNSKEQVRMLSSVFLQSLQTAIAHVSSYQVKELAALVQRAIDDGWPSQIIMWLQGGCSRSPTSVLHEPLAERNIRFDAHLNNNEQLAFKMLWDEWADSKIISESFAEEKIELLEYFQKKPSTGWKRIHKSITIDGLNDNESTRKNTSATTEAEPPSKGSSPKEVILTKEATPFLNPREICKRNGELLEALCINSTDERHIAVSSNRKGIIFVNWEDDLHSRRETDYVWSQADWPQNGWACAEPTPVPTYVSPSVGLGNKKGAHLELGGATIGKKSLAAPGRDLTGGGAFGIPGYAGMGASGLGWEVSEEFEELVEPLATLENVRGRAFSRHPSMPYFLVGSSNTHIYLWEFGKERATATYGVLPAANVPPPYSLASISALQFEHCGHRFATAALDGTVCTWQLEVGGRSNVYPTESSICFNDQATDVAYVTSSGTIIAAAGYSSNNVNVVIWDTIAPPSTSRASIICHEGGASSIAVFDKEIGSSSVSPLIVTGGKGGDVGLHDFRYIATGRSKRLQQNSPSSSSTTSEAPLEKTKQGAENVGGMLWYLPKAHSGSVTKISWISDTSLFLTGSKDGDVKLWDVKNAKLVHHWPKLHDRHTFLQPTTRGFGGVVRAGVTDMQVVSRGFLTCGGDGTVKLVEVGDYSTLNTIA